MTQLIDLNKVADILGVSYLRAAALAREGIIPVVALGRRYRCDPEKLKQFIDGGGRRLPGGWRRKPPEA
jgi:predicted site-specific integrase-resolvase